MEKTLQITEKQAKELHSDPEAFKKLLEINFGKKTFCKDITECVKSYEDACEILGRKPMNFNGMLKYKIALERLETIIEALNEGWFPDWSNSNELKWYPWLIWRSSGFRFDFTDFTYSYADVGSRLCLKEDRLAEFVGKEFEGLWDDYYKGR